MIFFSLNTKLYLYSSTTTVVPLKEAAIAPTYFHFQSNLTILYSVFAMQCNTLLDRLFTSKSLVLVQDVYFTSSYIHEANIFLKLKLQQEAASYFGSIVIPLYYSIIYYAHAFLLQLSIIFFM